MNSISYSALREANADTAIGVNALLAQLHSKSQPVTIIGLANHLVMSYIAVAKDDEKEGKIIGMAVLVPMYCVSHVFGKIHNLIVDKEYGGQQIGRRLIETLLKNAEKSDFWYIDMEVHSNEIDREETLRDLQFRKRPRSVFRLKLR